MKLLNYVLALFLLISPLSARSEKILKKSTSCEALLLAAREHHVLPSVSRNYTRAALQHLRMFRLMLKPPPYEPRPHAKATSAKSSSGRMGPVVGRIRGIELDSATSLAEEGKTNITVGFVLEGADSIRSIIQEVDKQLKFVH